MARLIPDFVSEDCKSSAERRLFARFKDELPDAFTVLHSLGVARHRYKPYSEADFVLVCPQAVIVFEVKGGRVKRKDGCWFSPTVTARCTDARSRRCSRPHLLRSLFAILSATTSVGRRRRRGPHSVTSLFFPTSNSMNRLPSGSAARLRHQYLA